MAENKRLVIFGVGNMGRAISVYAEKWGYELVAYCVDDQFRRADQFLGKPLISASELTTRFDQESCSVFVAIGYLNLNDGREDKCNKLRADGYRLASIINPEAFPPEYLSHGENCLIIPSYLNFEPHVTLGDGVYVWNNASLSHDVTVGDYSFISNGAIIGGNTAIGKKCFVGMGAVISHNLQIGDATIIGAGALISQDSPEEGGVFIPQSTQRQDINSSLLKEMLT